MRYYLLVFFEFIIILTSLMFIFFRNNIAGQNKFQAYSQLHELVTMNAANNETKVLGEAVSPTPTPMPTMLLTLRTVPVAVPTSMPVISLSKNQYTIAVYGDSMEDTMGERLEYLEIALQKRYPTVNFRLYNYGRGSQNVEDAYGRLGDSFQHQDRNYPPLAEIDPDVIVVGTFAYNPFWPHSVAKHTEYLTKLLKYMKTVSGNTYLLAEIAPAKNQFGQGPGGVNWSEIDSYIQATNIIALLENGIRVAEDLQIPVVDAFTPSIVGADKSGNLDFINVYDHIHPSKEGHEYLANLVGEKIRLE